MRIFGYHSGSALLRALSAICVFAALGAVERSAEASPLSNLIIDVQSVSAAPGSTGNTLDITVTNPLSNPTVDIGQVLLTIQAANPDITFTGATIGNPATYIFDNNSALGPSILASPAGNPINTTDSKGGGSGGGSLTAGAMAVLAHLIFDVAPGAVPSVSSVGVQTATSALVGPASGQVPYVANPGTITIGPLVTASSTVPEPATATLGFVGLVTILGATMRRR